MTGRTGRPMPPLPSFLLYCPTPQDLAAGRFVAERAAQGGVGTVVPWG